MSADWSTLAAGGFAIPALERRIELADMVAYAGATWDWHRLHYDPEVITAMGFPAAVVDGQVLGALMAEVVQDWLGPEAWIAKLAFRFRAPLFAGATVRCSGHTEASSEDRLVCTLEIVSIDADGVAGALAASGTAEVIRR